MKNKIKKKLTILNKTILKKCSHYGVSDIKRQTDEYTERKTNGARLEAKFKKERKPKKGEIRSTTITPSLIKSHEIQ